MIYVTSYFKGAASSKTKTVTSHTIFVLQQIQSISSNNYNNNNLSYQNSLMFPNFPQKIDEQTLRDLSLPTLCACYPIKIFIVSCIEMGGKHEALCFARKWNSEGEVGCKHRRRRWRTKRHELRSFGAGLVPMNRAGVESQWGPETSSKKKDKEPRNNRKEIQRRWQGRPEGWCKDVRPRRKLI